MKEPWPLTCLHPPGGLWNVYRGFWLIREFSLILWVKVSSVLSLLAHPGARASWYLAPWFPHDHPWTPFLEHGSVSNQDHGGYWVPSCGPGCRFCTKFCIKPIIWRAGLVCFLLCLSAPSAFGGHFAPTAFSQNWHSLWNYWLWMKMITL